MTQQNSNNDTDRVDMTPVKEKKARIGELDLIRGVAVILMIFDHFMFDLWGLMPSLIRSYPPRSGVWRSIYDTAHAYWTWDVREWVRVVVVFAFLSLTGICCSFSRSNIKRGLKLGAVALGLSAVTLLIALAVDDLDMIIFFGVLHCIALSLILVGLIEKLTRNAKFSKWIFLALGIPMTVYGFYLEYCSHMPYLSAYSTGIGDILLSTFLGTGCSGSDSFAFIFNCGQIFIGVFLGRTLYAKRTSLFGMSSGGGAVGFVGRHSLIVYFAHQLIIPVLLTAVLLACGFGFLGV